MKTFLLDVDCTDEDTNDVAKLIQHSLARMFNDSPIEIFGQYTDSGRRYRTEVVSSIKCSALDWIGVHGYQLLPA